MNGDPPEDDLGRQRREAARDEEERTRSDVQHDLESWARKQPLPGPGETPPDPVTVVRVRLPEHDGADLYALARWSLAARLVRDAAAAGRRGEVADLGPRALDIANSVGPDDIAPNILRHVGVAKGGEWLAWYPPVPPEPVPGTPGQRAARN